ncbi:GNAT family N-acetyltransferase [Pseudomonas sp. SC11]|uniref:GNAT family N-acetyltransferase n=1 Tax=Pseudomonas sp. SC11 TaxID=326927 RepID=UPI00399B88A1
MTPPDYQRLCHSQRRLLDHFYRQQGSRMRASGDGESWVARADGLIGALSLTPVAGGQWLTGLFVAEPWRRKGIAAGLIEASLAARPGPTWLFCHPDLQTFYARLGFDSTHTLPAELASRLARYQRSKSLVALVRAGFTPG